jgi:hypothetical protein
MPQSATQQRPTPGTNPSYLKRTQPGANGPSNPGQSSSGAMNRAWNQPTNRPGYARPQTAQPQPSVPQTRTMAPGYRFLPPPSKSKATSQPRQTQMNRQPASARPSTWPGQNVQREREAQRPPEPVPPWEANRGRRR